MGGTVASGRPSEFFQTRSEFFLWTISPKKSISCFRLHSEFVHCITVIVCRDKVKQTIHIWDVWFIFYYFIVSFYGQYDCSYPKSNSIKWQKLRIHHKQHGIWLVLFFYLAFTKENQSCNNQLFKMYTN